MSDTPATPEIDITNPAIQQIINAAVQEQVSAKSTEWQDERQRLVAHNEKILGEKKALSEQAQKASKLDDPEVADAMALLKAMRAKSDDDAIKRGDLTLEDYATMRTREAIDGMKEKHATELDAITTKAAQLEQLAQERLAAQKSRETEIALTHALTSAGVIPSALPLAVNSFRSQVQVDDDMRLTVLDDQGNPRISVADPTKSMQPEEFAQIIKQKKDYSFLFPTINGGGQAHGGDNASTGANPFSDEGWNRTKQIQLFNNDPDKAKQLQAAAGK